MAGNIDGLRDLVETLEKSDQPSINDLMIRSVRYLAVSVVALVVCAAVNLVMLVSQKYAIDHLEKRMSNVEAAR